MTSSTFWFQSRDGILNILVTYARDRKAGHARQTRQASPPLFSSQLARFTHIFLVYRAKILTERICDRNSMIQSYSIEFHHHYFVSLRFFTLNEIPKLSTIRFDTIFNVTNIVFISSPYFYFNYSSLIFNPIIILSAELLFFHLMRNFSFKIKLVIIDCVNQKGYFDFIFFLGGIDLIRTLYNHS